MTRMSVEVQGAARIRRNIDEALSMRRIGQLIEKATDFAEQEAERGAKPHTADLGKLSHGNNIRQELHGTPVALSARVYTNSPIVVAVDQGRPPGGRMPPISLIESWAARHGIGLHPGRGRSIRSGFRMARAIVRHGTKGVDFFKHAAKATERKIEGYVREAARKIEDDWGR